MPPRGIVKKGWTSAEDATILAMRARGSRWAEIARQLTDRTDDSVRTRYKRLAKKEASGVVGAAQNEMFSAEEDEVIAYLSAAGASWPEIAAELPGRTRNCVRVRWQRALRTAPIEQAPRYSPEEDEVILEGVVAGDTWDAIAARLPGRTRAGILKHWYVSGRPQYLASKGADWTWVPAIPPTSAVDDDDSDDPANLHDPPLGWGCGVVPRGVVNDDDSE